MPLIDDPEQLRMRAADMRKRADRAMYPETKQGLFRIAGDYDALAARAQQRLARLRNLEGGPDQSENSGSVVDQNPNQFQPGPSDKPEAG